MNTRLRRLHRLLDVRRIAEDAARAELQAAHAAVHRVQATLAEQRQAIGSASESSSSALGSGDRMEWLFAEAQSEVAAGNCERLSPVLDARWAAIEPATEFFLKTRRDRRQMEQLIAGIGEAERGIAARKDQSACDDWFLAQRMRKPR